MDFKPSDLYIGIVDFIAILLPGALLAFIIVALADTYILETFPILQNANAGWVAFLFVSYFLGHFIYLIGTQLDPLYDATYRQRYRSDINSLLERAKPITKKLLGTKFDEKDSILQWATIFVRLRAPLVATEIDRLEADSKFFRSITIVLFVTSIAFFWKAMWILGGGSILLCSLSLWRFMERRLKRTKLTYELFIASSRIAQVKSIE